ncbi:hypothetical protein GCM10017643_27290 [Ancylobacter dichloromethanicus]|uniref:Uncharacterized protein n=1 Tax=Ancylobacter dichloromethanicus TaxID=518825 RepID=A0A9W6MZY7_9HYPH|nr:hypothetical protein GCM10017643_27290 [Ancylobacter dichloromethanicus]
MQTTSNTALLRLASVLTGTLFLVGCVTTTAGEGTTGKAVCRSFRPITWSAQDTDETIAQVKAHNAVWREICGAGR